MADLKKKFLDILFDDEPEVIGSEPPVSSSKKPVEKEEVKEKEISNAPKATDILYGKQEKPSSFIDYFEVPKKANPQTVEEDEVYEMRDNVSPIFGLLNSKSLPKKKGVSEKEINKAINNNSKDGEYIGVVLSPIYGYDDSKANDARKSLEDKSVKDIKKEIHEEINKNLKEGFGFDVPFDVNDQTIEIAKEAIMESVVELNDKELIKNEDEEESISADQIATQLGNVFDNYVEDYTSEITKEDVEKAFKDLSENKDDDKYNTTPISLFDIDDLLDNKDGKDPKDIFDELIGDGK